MNFLIEYQRNFWNSSIPIRPFFSSPHSCNINTTNQNTVQTDRDVVGDLVSFPVASACLPVAKQISISDLKMSLKLPRIADLFIGILDQPIINQVIFTIHNHLETVEITGLKRTLDSNSIWILTDLPIPLICLNDYDTCFIEVTIHLNANYNLQTANQDVFKAYFGYFQKPIQYQLINQLIYNLPIIESTNNLKLICGLWTITSTI